VAELNGYIKLYRKLVTWGWYQDSVVKDLFLHFLLTASFKDFVWMGQKMKAGQLITGRKKLAEDLGFTEQQIRTAMEKLKSTGEITTKATNKYTVITVVNWANFQGDEEIVTNASTNEQPTNNQQITNKQPHRKNVKNDKNIITTTARTRVHTCESVKPSLFEIQFYISENKLNVDANAFYQKYEDNGWVTESGEPIQNWKNLIRVWHRKEPRRTGGISKAAKKNTGDYSAIDKDLLEKMLNSDN
jgi:hypothetical protein